MAAPVVVCPFYKYHSKNILCCDNVINSKYNEYTKFDTNKELMQFIQSVCASKGGAWKKCPLAEIILKKYESGELK